MTTAIVTGGAGFIGSHLCERLVELGHHVICIDNLCTGSRRNVAHLERSGSFTFLEADVCQPSVLWWRKADYIFHLASPASPEAYWRIPVETATTNALGAHQMLELAQRYNARFLLASTSEVYGDPLSHPQREDYWGNVNPIGPRSCYDEGKRFAEALAMTYHRSRRVDVRIARIFNTYGPRSDPADGRMIPNFIGQALMGAPITIYGSGDQTRSLCYVQDMVDGLLAVMLSEESSGEVFNLGSQDEMTIKECATVVREVCGSASRIEYIEAREEEPMRRRPDIGKATRLLGWMPKTSLQGGLEETVAWFRERLGETEMTAATDKAAAGREGWS